MISLLFLIDYFNNVYGVLLCVRLCGWISMGRFWWMIVWILLWFGCCGGMFENDVWVRCCVVSGVLLVRMNWMSCIVLYLICVIGGVMIMSMVLFLGIGLIVVCSSVG